VLRRLELDAAAHRDLAEHARARGIAFLSSVFDIESADMVAALGVPQMKIPSGEITNLPLLRRVGGFGVPVILSTGMATMAEIAAALAALEAAGTARARLTLLHCNSEYPTPYEDVNLRTMASLRESFGVAVGYSDHTPGIEVSVAAVALGAAVIEKHFTLDRTLPGPDHRASLDPAALKALVAAIRNVEAALGSARKEPSPSELKNRSVVRRSLVALRPIRAGEVFAAENVAAKRPEGGLTPMRWDEVMGRVARRDFAEDEPIEL
jgi:N,N'-diacetyllegionaminate synthase